MEQRNQDLEAFNKKFRLEELTLTQVGSWTLSLRPGQTTLGAMVLSVRSGTRDLGSLSRQEAVDMGDGFGLAERLAREVFGAIRVNILCLMMQDPIVHFHILPRYDGTVSQAGRAWTDEDWPGPPKITAEVTDDTVLHQIRDILRATL